MRLVRYGLHDGEKPGLLDDAGGVRDLSRVIPDLTGVTLSAESLDKLQNLKSENLPLIENPPRLGPPISGIGKIIGVGLNYRDHAEECGLPIPKEPALFLKATSALCGPHDDLVLPKDSSSVDWEVELAVVIGQSGAYISETRAMNHVAGYCIGIDFSEREFQFNRGGQGFKGKSADSFAPLGPWFVSADAIGDPHRLELRLNVNGTERQAGSTRDMIFSVPELIAYISRFMSLQAGDVILTGTPAGVGLGQAVKRYLRAGDRVEASMTGLGSQLHRAIDYCDLGGSTG